MNNRRQTGFTLLELLIAISIFALVSIMAFSGLDTSLHGRQQIESQADRLIQLQKTFNLMREDFEQAVPRAVRDQLGDFSPKSAFMQVENGLLFTRGGRANPLDLPRSSLERVGWGLKDGKLVRARFPVLDQPTDPKFNEYALLDNVESLRFRFLGGQDKRWLEQWPPLDALNSQDPMLPRGVEVTLELKDLGTITRVFVLPF